MTDRPPPLQGIRVLDFSRIIAGPLCTQQLADLGADVIKVEHPVTGDEMRTRSSRGDRRGAAFLAFNRSKRSIAMDLGVPAGQDLARRLAATSDVVVENFRPGVMDRLGLGPAALRAALPRLIYVSISAYGASGAFAARPGLDPILQAESGMMAMTGPIDGGPTRHPLSLIDTLTAANATSAICAALLGRNQHGQGDFIDLCLLDTAVGALSNVALQYLTDGRLPERSGNRHVVGAPIDLFDTATEPIYLAMATDRLFADLCRAIERPDLIDDERFTAPSGRTRHRGPEEGSRRDLPSMASHRRGHEHPSLRPVDGAGLRRAEHRHPDHRGSRASGAVQRRRRAALRRRTGHAALRPGG